MRFTVRMKGIQRRIRVRMKEIETRRLKLYVGNLGRSTFRN